MPVLMNITETAVYTTLAKQTIYDYVHKKRIPYYKAGRKLLFSTDELNKWLRYGGDEEASKRVINER